MKDVNTKFVNMEKSKKIFPSPSNAKVQPPAFDQLLSQAIALFPEKEKKRGALNSKARKAKGMDLKDFILKK